MSRGLLIRYTFLFCLPSLGCGGGTHTPGDNAYAASVKPGTRLPADSVERGILARLDTMDADSSVQLEGKSVLAGASYHAASGRLCRRISIDGAEGSLACQMADGWHFVPSIYVGNQK